MQHLNDEDLARLVEEPADEHEAAHLASCAACHAELQGMIAQRDALRRLPALPAPAGGWDALERRLLAEGLMQEDAAVRPIRRFGSPAWRAAAALVLFAAGAGVGWGVRGDAAAPVAAAGAPATTEEALRLTEQAYLEALTRYAEESGLAASSDPLNQLATLEGIVLTTRAALEQAPADPVINGYHLAALSQREALLRQIDRTAQREWF